MSSVFVQKKKNSLGWTKVDKYHIRKGEFTVCKLMVAGVPGYMAYNGRTFLGLYETAEGAIHRAEQVRSAEKADGSRST